MKIHKEKKELHIILTNWFDYFFMALDIIAIVLVAIYWLYMLFT